MNDYIVFEQHLWVLFDNWKRITQQDDLLYYKQLFAELRLLAADTTDAPEPLMLRLFDLHDIYPTVKINLESPRPVKELSIYDYLNSEKFYGSLHKGKPKGFTLREIIWGVASADSTNHHGPVRPSMRHAQIAWGNSRYDINLLTHAASRLIVCGFDFLQQLKDKGIYSPIRDWDSGAVNCIRSHYWR